MTLTDGFWRRLTHASLAFVQTYQEAYLSPAERPGLDLAHAREHWDSYQARLFRYNHYYYYYANKAYTALTRYAATHRAARGLYKHTRSLYNPIFRLVELLAAKAFVGGLDWEEMATGAVPFDRLDNAHRRAITQVWKWSNMASFKTRFPRDCARFGDAVIKVVDDPFKAKVWFELIHPGLIADAIITPQGFFEEVLIAYYRQDTPLEAPWYYEEIITKDTFATFRDGEPWGAYVDEWGQSITRWPNPYGFVPLVLTRAIELEHSWGAAPFFQIPDKIDQINDLASITYDQVRKAVNPMWYLENVSSLTQVQTVATGEETSPRDNVPVMLGPMGSRPQAMVAQLDIDAALRAIDKGIDEIEKDHPELALHRLAGGERVTAPGTLSTYDDGIQRIADFRAVCDAGLLRAHQIALAIGGWRGYEGFSGFDLDSYARGDLDFELAERPILRDSLTKRERLELMQASGAPRRWIWSELNKSRAEIAQAEREIDQRRAAFADPDATPNPDADEDEETPTA